ncbi:hypothetical protein H4R34_004649 [Dimargaris verticillata]|uniref:Uncharacterized protein n=1 Tax=Dimargaris verticillata TaxID=2761393 RepID=A0A9W8B3W5_9FUNG|nr:hypothetical protein H4R34_004649 [Dimargaris verticillata]
MRQERAEGANPISFCKCHCGQNVTIIPISPIPEKDACNKCTKAFCTKLEPNLCEGAGTGETVSVACFQRDSYKDEAIVWIFLLVTAALLAWALFKPCLLRHYRNYRAPSNTYSTLPS